MAYGFTKTLPTITGSHTDFILQLKTADFPSSSIDGTANAFATGGSDMVAYEDDTKAVRLPLHIKEFVSSGTPAADVRIKVDASTSATVYLEADTTQVSQPAASSTYGSEAVYSNTEYSIQYNTSAAVDAANKVTPSTVGTPTSDSESLDFDGTSDRVDIPSSTATQTQSIFSLYADADPTDASSSYLFWKRGGTNDGFVFRYDVTNTRLSFTFFGIAAYNSSTVSVTSRSRMWATINGTTLKFYVNGSQVGSNITISATRNTHTDDMHIAARSDQFGVVDGYSAQQMWESRFYTDEISADRIAALDDNYSSSSWGTSSAWVDSGSGATIPVFNKHFRNQGMQ